MPHVSDVTGSPALRGCCLLALCPWGDPLEGASASDHVPSGSFLAGYVAETDWRTEVAWGRPGERDER